MCTSPTISPCTILQQCFLKYSLPGVDALLLDLATEDDLHNMVEEYEEFVARAAFTGAPVAKLKLYLDVQVKARWARASSGSTAAAAQHAQHAQRAQHEKEAAAAAAAEAQAPLPLPVPLPNAGSGPLSVSSAAAAAPSSSASSSGSCGARRHPARGGSPAAYSGACPLQRPARLSQPGLCSGSSALASGGGARSSGSTCSLEDGQDAAVREQLQAYVRDLRARVEVIRPWELQVVRLLGAGAFGEVRGLGFQEMCV